MCFFIPYIYPDRFCTLYIIGGNLYIIYTSAGIIYLGKINEISKLQIFCSPCRPARLIIYIGLDLYEILSRNIYLRLREKFILLYFHGAQILYGLTVVYGIKLCH